MGGYLLVLPLVMRDVHVQQQRSQNQADRWVHRGHHRQRVLVQSCAVGVGGYLLVLPFVMRDVHVQQQRSQHQARLLIYCEADGCFDPAAKRVRHEAIWGTLRPGIQQVPDTVMVDSPLPARADVVDPGRDATGP